MAELKIFEVDGCAWFVAHNLMEFLNWYHKNVESIEDVSDLEDIKIINPKEGQVKVLKSFRDYTEVCIAEKPVYVGDELTWQDTWASVKGVVKFGVWEQDGSGGEYPPVKCRGFFVEVIDVNPLPFDDLSQQEVMEYYPVYRMKQSLVALIESDDTQELRIVD